MTGEGRGEGVCKPHLLTKEKLGAQRKRPIKQIHEFISHTPETTGLTTAPCILPSPYSGRTGFAPLPPWPPPLHKQTSLSSGWAQVPRCASLRDTPIAAPQRWGRGDGERRGDSVDHCGLDQASPWLRGQQGLAQGHHAPSVRLRTLKSGAERRGKA